MVVQEEFSKEIPECSNVSLHNAILPMCFSCGHFDFNAFQATIFFEAVRMEDAFFVHVEAGRVLHVACPFHYGINEVFRFTVAKGIVIIVFALAQHFGKVESGGLINEVEDH